jgi:hypothetical protein
MSDSLKRWFKHCYRLLSVIGLSLVVCGQVFAVYTSDFHVAKSKNHVAPVVATTFEEEMARASASNPPLKYLSDVQLGLSSFSEEPVEVLHTQAHGLPFAAIIALGYRYSQRYALEASYFKFPDEDLYYLSHLHVQQEDAEALALSVRFMLSGAAIKRDVNTFVKVGVAWLHEAWLTDELSQLADLSSKERAALGIHDNLGFVLGFGMNWGLTRSYGVTAQYTTLMSFGQLPTMSNLGVGLYYRF